MADERVNFILTARDTASTTVKKLSGELGALGGAGSKAAGPMAKLGAVTGGLISPTTLAIGGATALGAALFKATGDASDQAEALNKLRVVYGTSAGDLEEFADTAATSLGMSETAALGALGTFGNLFTAMGTGQQDASDMSQKLVTLAADLASFNNIDPTEVLEKLRAGIVGEAEPLRTLGVNITAARTEAKALELGLYDGVGALTAAQKASANYALILEDTEAAQGDFAETSDGLANSQRILEAQLEDVSAEVGAKLLPIITDLMNFLKDDGIPILEEFTGLLDVTNKNSADGIPILEQMEDGLNGVSEFLLKTTDNLRMQLTAVQDWQAASSQSYSDARADVQEYAEAHDVSWDHAAESLAGSVALQNAAMDGAAPYLAQWQQSVTDSAATAATDFDASTDDIVEDVKQTPGEMAKAALDGLSEWEESWDLLEEARTRSQDKNARIRNTLARLQSYDLAQGLSSQDDNIRNAAEQLQADLLLSLELDGYQFGWNLMNTYKVGIIKGTPMVTGAATDAMLQVHDIIAVSSEPKDHSSPLYGITKWGGNLVKTYAEGITDEMPTLTSAATAMADTVATIINPATVAPWSIGGGTALRSTYAGATDTSAVHVHFDSTMPTTPGQATSVVKTILPELVRELSRQRR